VARTPARRDPPSAATGPLGYLFAGGTIATAFDPAAGGGMVKLGASDLVAAAPALRALDPVVEDLRAVPGNRLDSARLLEIAAGVRRLRERGCDSIVMTHGTDTLEEVAMFLHCTHTGPVPVVITGAMRLANDPAWDGPANLDYAARLAVSPAARGAGVLVALGGEAHHARYAVKRHSVSSTPFASDRPVARANDWLGGPMPIPPGLKVSDLSARIHLVTAYAGWAGEGIPEVLDGLIVESFGAGNLPPAALEVLAPVAARLPVVLATRTHAGPIEPIYAYAGSVKAALDAGLIPLGHCSGAMARTALLCVLGAGLRGRDVALAVRRI
jgi:L-asparaginase